MAGVTTKVFAKDRPVFSRLKAMNDEQLLMTSVTAVPFNTRAQKRLAAAGVGTLGELIVKSRYDLLKLSGMGQASVDQIEAYLGELDLSLSGGTDDTDETVAPPTPREKELEGLLMEARAVIEKLAEALS